MIFWFSVIAVAINVVKCETNLLVNGDFEDTTFTKWFCMGQCMGPSCHFISSTMARGGNYSVKVTTRTEGPVGLAQNVDVTAGERYNITAYIKLLNTTGNSSYQTVAIMEACNVTGSNVIVYTRVAATPYMVTGQWFEVGGLIQIAAGSVDCVYYIQTDTPAEYLVDDASVTHIPTSEFADWVSETDDRIDHLRKSTLSIRLTGLYADQNTPLSLEVEQRSMEFVMGANVEYWSVFTETFKDVFYNNFEWASLYDAQTWLEMQEYEEMEMTTDEVTEFFDFMFSEWIKMRCHSVLSNNEDKNPEWVQHLSGTNLTNKIETRVNGVVNLTKGLCEHWDVNEEMLHWDFFERITGNPSITADTFHAVHDVDAKAQLFLDDFELISGSDFTVAMKNTALKYKAANVPIGGIGAKGHMNQADHQLVKGRLDTLAEAGLPIMVTEFFVKEQDENVKAHELTDLMRMFFSHPAVEGVVLWGFWDGQISHPDSTLFVGENVTANAAGRAYQDLFSSAWRTHEFTTITGNGVYNTRAFKGDYRVRVTNGIQLLGFHNFTLSDDDQNITINVNEILGYNGVPNNDD